MYCYKNEKYIIFLNDKFFKKSLFKSYYNKIVTNLENKGITVVSNSDILQYQINGHKKLCFDDKDYPDMNCLYIHLFNGRYYNDIIYVKKKIETEREMLTLLAGKLGVKQLYYSSIITETTLLNVKGGVKLNGVDTSIKYTRDITTKNGTSGKEIYLNRGAPVYITSKDLQEVDANIKEKFGSMKSNIFSYDFYKNNPKLESFVYKRFEFKMQHLEYTIDVEDISDKSFAIKSCFMDYGIGLMIDRNSCYNETINYVFDFFSDEELRVQLIKNQRLDSDEFGIIREAYEASNNKELEVEYICEYVKMEASRCHYTLPKEDGNQKMYNCQQALYSWINTRSEEEFIELCHNFVSTMQIRAWIIKTLTSPKTSSHGYNSPLRRPVSPGCYSLPRSEDENITEKYIIHSLPIPSPASDSNECKLEIIMSDSIIGVPITKNNTIPEKLNKKIYKLSEHNTKQCYIPP